MSWYRMERGWLDHPAFANDGFNDRSAFAWLIENAAFRPKTVVNNGISIELQPGQLSFSTRFLAQKWGWKKGRVEGLLKRLKAHEIIRSEPRTSRRQLSANSRTAPVVITICNYEKYQNVEADPRTSRSQLSGRSPDKEEQGYKDTSISRSISPESDGDFERFWMAYPQRSGANPKKPARQKFDAHVRRGIDPAAIIAGAERYAREMAADNRLGTKFVAQAQTWLSQERWADEEAPPSPDPLAAWMA